MIDDNKLLLYYWNDGLDPHERDAIRRALEKDGQLARRYEDLRAELTTLKQVEAAEAPDTLAERLHAQLEGQSQPSAPPRARWSWPRFPGSTWLIPALAALALGIGIGVYLPPATVDTYPANQPAFAPVEFRRGLAVHLEDSRAYLGSLQEAGTDERTLLLERITEQNRQFEKTATANGAADVARVLRAFEPVLLRLAAEPPGSDAHQNLRNQLDFELNVVLTKLQRQPSEQIINL